MGKSLTQDIVLSKSKCDNLYSVKNLNLWGNDIDDMSLLKNMPNVEVLSLSVNKISSLKDFAQCNKLQELYLRKNNIQNIKEVQYLINLKHLKVLWLWDNPVAQTQNYREIIIKTLPNLTKLDNTPVTQEEIVASQNIQLPFESKEISLINNSNNCDLINQQSQVYQQQYQFQQVQSQQQQCVQSQYQENLKENINLNIQHQENKISTNQVQIQQKKQIQKKQYSDNGQVNNNISVGVNSILTNAQNQYEKKISTKENILYAIMTLLKELETNQLELLKKEIDKKLVKE